MAKVNVKWAFLQHSTPVQRSVDPVGILSEKQMAFGILEGFQSYDCKKAKNYKAITIGRTESKEQTYAAIICHNDELSLCLTWDGLQLFQLSD